MALRPDDFPQLLSVHLSTIATIAGQAKGARLPHRRALQIVDFGRPIGDCVDALLHVSARSDALTAARQRAFIAARLLTSIITLAAFPLYIAVRGVPDAFEVLAFGWLATPMLVAHYLSRTGRYDRAQALSALSLAGLCIIFAAAGGGITAIAAIWLLIIPFESALSASTRTLAFAVGLACAVAGLLIVLDMHGKLPAAQAPREWLAALGALAAAVHVSGIAFSAQSLAHTSNVLLRLEQDRYRSLTITMADAITRHGANGAVLHASPAAESLFGVAVCELLGQGLHDRVHEADRHAYLVALADAAALGRTVTIEFHARHGTAERNRKAKYIWLEMNCQPLGSASATAGNEREVVALMRDISDRKAQQQAVEDVGAELIQANDANGKLLATLSHELRTPLNAIIGFSQVLAKLHHAPRDDTRWRSYAQLINESGTHMMSVVEAMLDASMIEKREFKIVVESLHPAPVIKSCCDLLAIEVRRAGLDLVLRLDRELPEISADARAFRQIMINLVSNAVKYTDRGGRITVRARVEGSALAITVEDTGIGVASEDIPRLVEPFFQTRTACARRQSGTGLGLSIVKGLVTLHGGELDIASRIGDGTRVTVRLPLACKMAEPPNANRVGAPRQAIARTADNSDIRVKKSA